MDRLLVIPSVPQTEWVQEILPGTSPAELPLAGRYAIDYVLERLRTIGVPVIEILDFHPTKSLDEAFKKRIHDTEVVFYQAGEGPMPPGLDNLARVPGPLTQDISDGLVKFENGIGFHVHVGDAEIYYVYSGKGEYNDNGTIVPIEAGDVTFCPAGTGHGVLCVGDEPLELIALILYE